MNTFTIIWNWNCSGITKREVTQLVDQLETRIKCLPTESDEAGPSSSQEDGDNTQLSFKEKLYLKMKNVYRSPQKSEARPQWTVPPVSWWQRADTIPAAVEGPAPYCIAIQRWIGAGLLCSRPLCPHDTHPDGGSVPQNALYFKASTDHWGPRNGPKSCGPAVVNVIIRKLPDTFTMWKHRRYSWFDLYFKIVDLDQVSSSVR